MDFIVIKEVHQTITIIVVVYQRIIGSFPGLSGWVGGGGTSLGTRLQTIIVEVHHTRGLSENTN